MTTANDLRKAADLIEEAYMLIESSQAALDMQAPYTKRVAAEQRDLLEEAAWGARRNVAALLHAARTHEAAAVA
jgi:hypothetical protein